MKKTGGRDREREKYQKKKERGRRGKRLNEGKKKERGRKTDERRRRKEASEGRKEREREGIFRWKRDAKKDGRKSIFFFFFFELTPSSHEYTQLTESRLSWLGLSETHCFFREM